MKKLQKVGYNHWFEDHIDTEMTAIHEVARVVTVHKDSYIVTRGDEVVFAEISGNLSYTANSASDLPTSGDWVYLDFYDDDTHAIIYGVLPRKTLLKRKTSGKMVDFQLIAANIDVAFIIQSADNNFNLRRLERYLVMVNESQLTPVILLSKSDLLPQHEVSKIHTSISNIAPQTTILAFSSFTGENVETIKNSLLPGSTYCLLGSSGVGKTTLLNNILGNDRFETQPVSKKGNKGKHTTTNRELILLDGGAMIIDTPGMRELGNLSIDSGIDATFSDIIEISQRCKFANCAHNNEIGCAILSALNDGVLSEKRYKNYIKIKKEASFYEMSNVEKKKKDKNFGKLIKTAINNKNRR